MRTFKYASKQRFPNSYYNTRLSREWDINLQINQQQTVPAITTKLQELTDQLVYGLVGGLEFSSRDDHHVHIALVFTHEVSKKDVLKYLGNPVGQKYASPRNQKWPYCGWKVHHCKKESKVESDETKHILWEWGQLPADSEEKLLDNEQFLRKFFERNNVSKSIYDVDKVLKRIAHIKIDRKFGQVSTFVNPNKEQQEIIDAAHALLNEDIA